MNTTTIKVIDRRYDPNEPTVTGLFNDTVVHFGLKKECTEEDQSFETVLIKYGKSKIFEPCSIYPANKEGHVYVSGAISGRFGDIRMQTELLVKILGKLDSTIVIKEWEEKIAA